MIDSISLIEENLFQLIQNQLDFFSLNASINRIINYSVVTPYQAEFEAFPNHLYVSNARQEYMN